jgi:hypothetical protein
MNNKKPLLLAGPICVFSVLVSLTLALVVPATAIAGKSSKESYGSATGKGLKPKSESWFSWLWPLGDRIEVETLKDKYVPFQTEKGHTKNVSEVYKTPSPRGPKARRVDSDLKNLPKRPSLMVEVGDGFLGTGKLSPGFEVPFIGAVWQPRLWTYVINRTAFQTFKDGRSGNRTETELANRTDLFFNLQLTGTEKIVLGLRPTDNNRPNRFTRYTFEGREKGFNKEFGLNVETLFFEGDIGSLFPNLDKAGIKPIDYGFTVGRQPIVFQEGILINDTVDAVGIVRNNIPFYGTSNLRISGMWSWNRLDRNDQEVGNNADMYGLFVAADTHYSTLNFDTIYVDDAKRDGLYFGVSSIQRVAALGGISTAFRANVSYALDEEVGGNVIGNGILLTSEISKTVPGSDDIVYFNSFLGLGNFTQAGREAVVGGPLANTGILFASPNLSTYGAEINPFTDNDVIGGAIGYQAFWDNKRRNLILEIAGRHDLSGEGFDSLGFGFQVQQAVGRHAQLQFEGFYTLNERRDNGYGARAEIKVVY